MKKNIIIGIAAIGVSLVLLIAFIIGGVTKIQTGPAAVVERLETALNKGNYDKAMVCFGIDPNSMAAEYDILGLESYGYDVNLIPGEVEEIEGETNRVKMQVAFVTTEDEEVVYDIETFTFVKNGVLWVIDIF